MKWSRTLAVQMVSIALLTLTARSQDDAAGQSSAEDLKTLRKKIEELEQKVKQLEQKSALPAAEQTKQGQVDELEQKVKMLERNREHEQEASETKARETPKITLGDKGFSFSTADGSFGVQIKGVLQVDSRTFIHDAGIAGNDTLLLRRARPILQGTLFNDIDFQFVPDFGGTGGPQIFDAWINYRLKPAIQLQAGKFKSPVGLEQLQSDPNTLFNERSIVTGLMPNRDIGFMLHGDLFGGVVSYGAGIFNGLGDGRNSSNADFDDNKEFAGRIFFQPLLRAGIAPVAGLGFGLGGSYADQQTTNSTGLPATTGGTLGGYATDGQQQFFAYNPTNGVVLAGGEHWRLSPQGYYYYGPFGLFGEYVISSQKVQHTGGAPIRPITLEHTGWEISALWNLTGEDALYDKPVVPRKPFSLANGGWGAWQLVARYAEVDIDDAAFPVFANPRTSATQVQSWSIGLNWWLNRNLRFNTSFSHADFQGGGGPGTTAPAAITRRNEDVVFTRLQLAF